MSPRRKLDESIIACNDQAMLSSGNRFNLFLGAFSHYQLISRAIGTEKLIWELKAKMGSVVEQSKRV